MNENTVPFLISLLEEVCRWLWHKDNWKLSPHRVYSRFTADIRQLRKSSVVLVLDSSLGFFSSNISIINIQWPKHHIVLLFMVLSDWGECLKCSASGARQKLILDAWLASLTRLLSQKQLMKKIDPVTYLPASWCYWWLTSSWTKCC